MRLLVSTGEISGDLQGSWLVKALREEAAARKLPLCIHALGGTLMEQAGAQLLANTTSLSAVGLWEALPFVVPTLRLQARVDAWIRTVRLDGVVLIDYMGPNVNLGLKLRRMNPDLPISYYIAPQEWAFRVGEGGTTRLIGFSSQILAAFSEEARFYKAHGAVVHWVGHPLMDIVRNRPERAAARARLNLGESSKLLLLLPASRSQEIRYLLPPLLEGAARLQRRHPTLQVIIPAGRQSFVPTMRQQAQNVGLMATVLDAREAHQHKAELFAAADLALSKSGTVNLELALYGVPQVVGYRLSRPTAWVARHVLNFQVPFISPVNLVLNEPLVPELLQNGLTPSAIADHGDALLTSDMARQRLLDGYGRLRSQLGQPGVARRAAQAILGALRLSRGATPSSSTRS
ncbi:MAG: lipid-A-disaccharide synthase [Candidatus Synechococcus spongiarum SP3]|uniref:Lipid-A-disaccharide synthase n=1 Tax=Candidatus Synechococcus spongiarum SP3 TaxID=1604020 RepID=A0A0G2IWZ3_9SYNE|nr:MAG: lipid-A-disaccharide synthase [Candidatus Synechococcus spongiarum SP3]